MKILIVGDVVGSPGRLAFARVAAPMKQQGKADVVIVNAENAAAGKGLTRKVANELFESGADVITLGDHAWDQKELETSLDSEPRIIRPANFGPGCPGKGHVTVETPLGPVLVINLMGRTFMRPCDCPFRTADAILAAEGRRSRVVVVDFHAEATSEKGALGRYLDGRASVVAGTHTHVQTSDECILPRGTAFISDLGMTGPCDSILGCQPDPIIRSFITGMRARFEVAKESATSTLGGLLVTVDEQTGRAKSVKRILE